MKNLLHWIEARRRFHLSHAQIQMAQELGLNPKKFGKLANHRQEPWKLPLPRFIEELYFKQFGKRSPDRVLSLEEWVREKKQKKQEKKARKEQETTAIASVPVVLTETLQE